MWGSKIKNDPHAVMWGSKIKNDPHIKNKKCEDQK
jgi:hypothetical protein